MPPWTEILNYIWFVFFSSCAGLLAHLTESHEKGERPTIYESILKMAGSAFAGTIAIYGCLAFDASNGVMGASAGLAGWLGATFVRTAADRLLALVKTAKGPQ